MTLLPPSLPRDARYRPLRAGTLTSYDVRLADVTPIVLPRGILLALGDHVHHSCTPLQRPLGQTGICRGCDLIALAHTHMRALP